MKSQICLYSAFFVLKIQFEIESGYVKNPVLFLISEKRPEMKKHQENYQIDIN